MTFLDNLFSFERPLRFGKEILRRPRRLKEIIFGSDEPRIYMAHQTRAGLYAVLPHNADKSLFVLPGNCEINGKKQWENNSHIANNFMVANTYQKRKDGRPMIYGSTLSKMRYDPKMQMGIRIDVSYLVSSQGRISSLRLGYGIIKSKEMIGSRIDFQIYRSRFNGELIAQGPSIENWGYLEFGKYERIDHEKTLENLVELVLPANMTQKSLISLFDLDYVEKMLLH